MNREQQFFTSEKLEHSRRVNNLEVESDLLNSIRGNSALIADYVAPDETIVGCGYGGSESMTLFLTRPDREKFVRKILSERLVTSKWDRDGSDVMLPPCQKARQQTQYLTELPNSLRTIFPQVLDVVERERRVMEGNEYALYHEYIYDMTFIPGIEVSQFIRKYRPSGKIVAALYSVIFRLLNQKIHRYRRRLPKSKTLEQSYFQKIEKRLILSQNTAPKTFSDRLLQAEEIMINGKKMLNVPSLLREFRQNSAYHDILEPTFHSLVVGDTNTENIKIGNIEPLLREYSHFSITDPPFTAEDLEIRFLDPRAIGFHEDGVDTCADDPMYDNKPWHNSLGNYDKIHGEHFDLGYKFRDNIPHIFVAFHEDNPYEYSYSGIEQHFKEVMTAAWRLDCHDSDVNQNDINWLIRFVFLTGTHFMAMPPFHFSKREDGILIDDAHNQSRPLAIYAEGIQWLNLALNLLQGKIDEFYGFSVPNLKNKEIAAAA